MNIKVKAGLEVAGFIAAGIVLVTGVQTILRLAVDTYGTEAVANRIAFGFMSVAAYVAVSLLYDMRVAKLQRRANLEEMTKK